MAYLKSYMDVGDGKAVAVQQQQRQHAGTATVPGLVSTWKECDGLVLVERCSSSLYVASEEAHALGVHRSAYTANNMAGTKHRTHPASLLVVYTAVSGTHCGSDRHAQTELVAAAATMAAGEVVSTCAGYAEKVQTSLPFVPSVPGDLHSGPGYVHVRPEALTGTQRP